MVTQILYTEYQHVMHKILRRTSDQPDAAARADVVVAEVERGERLVVFEHLGNGEHVRLPQTAVAEV